MAVTDAWLKATNGKGIGIVVTRTDRDGLSVRISGNGKLTFQVRYRYNGKAKRMDLGSYPLMSLKKARDENLRLRFELEQGYDPSVVRSIEKQAIIYNKSLADLFATWYNTQCVHDVKKPEQIKRTFEIHVLPVLGKIPADKIMIQSWLSLLEDLSTKVPQIASRVLTQTKKLYKWGVKRGELSFNPLADITAKVDLKIKRPTGKRILSDDEIALIWKALRGTRISPHNKLMIKLCLFFGCRTGELRLAKKTDFDLETMIWTVPPENHKKGNKTEKPLIRPIISEIVPSLQRAIMLSKSKHWAFTQSNSNEPMRENAQIDTPYSLMQWLRKKEGIEMPHWSTHDLRRTMRTNMSTITPPHIAEIMVGHALPEMYQVYDHQHYLEEQDKAYIAWFKRIESIVGDF
jgi:integrase